MEQITITLPLPEACTLLEWLYQRNSREDLPERCFSHHRPQPDRPGPDAGLKAESHGNSPI